MSITFGKTYTFSDETLYEFDSDLIEVVDNDIQLKLQQQDIDFTENFTTDTGFTYDSDRAEFSGGKVQQKLDDVTGQSFTEDFADDTGFTYDSDLVEFSGGKVQQKDKRPVDAIFYVDFSDNNEDADWTEVGTGVGTLSDGATVHDGKLDLTGYVANRRLSINAYNTSHSSQQGCMRCLFTPNYSGAPSQLQYIMQWRNGGLENNIQVLQNTSRFLQAWIRDGSGGNILTSASFGVYNFVADTTYEIEFNWDCDSGEHRLFINGIQQGSTQSGTGTRDGRIDQFDFGVYYNNLGQPDFSISKFIYFNAVQHTTDYTPDWSDIYSYDYVTSRVELPTMTYSGTQIKEFTGITSTESGSPKYILNDKYWTGTAWSSSDGTYAQANTLSDVNTNISSLVATGNTLNVDVIFDNANTQSHVDNLQVDYTGNKYLETSVILPEMEHIGDGTIKLFNNFITTESGTPRYLLQIERSGNYLYWTGTAWATSDGTYSQATSASVFDTNCTTLPVSGKNYGQFKIVFPEGTTQNYVSSLTANMNVDVYPTSNPTVSFSETIDMEALLSFIETSSKSGNDEVKFILLKNGFKYYFSGTSWVTSDGTYSQANTASEIETNKDTFTETGKTFGILMFIHSDQGTTSPLVTSIYVAYDFWGGDVGNITKCLVYGTCYKENGVVDSDVQIRCTLTSNHVTYNDEIILENIPVIETETDENGYWEIELIETENMNSGIYWIFSFLSSAGRKIYKKSIPNQKSVNFVSL